MTGSREAGQTAVVPGAAHEAASHRHTQRTLFSDHRKRALGTRSKAEAMASTSSLCGATPEPSATYTTGSFAAAGNEGGR